MADFILKTTPDILEGYIGDLHASSQTLRKEMKRISSILSSVYSSVENPGLTDTISQMRNRTEQFETFSDDLDGLSDDILKLNEIYKEAEKNYAASIGAELDAALNVGIPSFTPIRDICE